MTTPLHRALAVAGALLGFIPAAAIAQQGTTISGRVTSDATTPLPGVSVSIVAMNLGAYTDAQGNYTITVPAARATGQTVTLTAKRIGYQAKSVSITLTGASITQDYTMVTTPTQLLGVVVTALGVQRERSQLGTAQQQVTASEITNTKTLNIVDQLAGKVSGVQITGAGTQGGSSNMVIRGQNSITGNNQPLFVVDGVPLSNNNSHAGSPNGAFDFGSAVNDLNPEDVETMSVLKGPNAAALYGSRATNGVIVITTKKGRSTGGRARVDATTSFTFDTPSRLWDYQNLYGQGAAGDFQYVDGAGGGKNDGLDQSFGPRFDGKPRDQFTGKGMPWVAHPDNVKSFFNTGHTSSTTIAVTGGTDRANARLSVGSDNVEGIIPNNFFQKTSGLLSGNLQVSDNFSTNATLQYVRNSARNRPGTGYNTGILEQFIWFGRNVDVQALKNYKQTGGANGGPDDREYNWNYNFHNNPWWLQYENPLYDARDRFIASASASYKVNDWVNATLSSGSDIYRYNIDQKNAHGNLDRTNPSYQGGFSFVQDYRNENNTQLLVTANHGIGGHLQFAGTAGGNMRNEQSTSTSQATNGISVADIYNVSNAAVTPTLGQAVSRRQVNSMFGSAAFTYNNWWTVEGTARNDWSSTLPQANNSYFYPSVNTAVVLTDAMPAIKDYGVSFLKLRGSIAQVGNDASPYQLRTTYVGNSAKFNGLPQFSLDNAIANPNLKPEITKAAEAGIEVAILDGRVSLDASYYGKSTRDQIFNISISPTSGFSSKAINAGRIDNKGVEALLTMIPIRTASGFEWTSTLNFTKNKSKVVTLNDQIGVDRIVLGTTWGTSTEARVGQAYGAIFGRGFVRDSATNQRVINGGFTQPGVNKVLGNVQPKWLGSVNNTFSFKNYSLNVLFDMRRGGQFFSVSNFWGDYAGITQASLKGREVDWNNPGVVAQGISRASCGAGSGTVAASFKDAAGNTVKNDPKYVGTYRCVGGGTANKDTVTAEDYFQSIYPVTEGSIYENNWVKLRELRFSVDVPQRFVNRLHAQSANVAFVGRNLFMWTNVPNIDPEFSYTTGNYQGSEFAALPNPRSLGLSIRVTP
jgi:TonB-linked SusC/RagA family outer membrane protein